MKKTGCGTEERRTLRSQSGTHKRVSKTPRPGKKEVQKKKNENKPNPLKTTRQKFQGLLKEAVEVIRQLG